MLATKHYIGKFNLWHGYNDNNCFNQKKKRNYKILIDSIFIRFDVLFYEEFISADALAMSRDTNPIRFWNSNRRLSPFTGVFLRIIRKQQPVHKKCNKNSSTISIDLKIKAFFGKKKDFYFFFQIESIRSFEFMPGHATTTTTKERNSFNEFFNIVVIFFLNLKRHFSIILTFSLPVIARKHQLWCRQSPLDDGSGDS